MSYSPHPELWCNGTKVQPRRRGMPQWQRAPPCCPNQLVLFGTIDRVTSLSLFTFMHWRRKWQPTPVFSLENPRDRGAWWAAVYGVTQSQTWLKWRSSSSSREMFGASQLAQWQRTHLPIQEMQVRSLGWKEALENKMATYSSILASEIPCTEEPGEL